MGTAEYIMVRGAEAIWEIACGQLLSAQDMSSRISRDVGYLLAVIEQARNLGLPLSEAGRTLRYA